MPFEATVYVCSKCHKASPDASNLRRHISICKGEEIEGRAEILRKRARFEVFDMEVSTPLPPAPPMSPVHRLPAFDDEEADDARIEWLFRDEHRMYLKDLLADPDITRIASKAFKYLWSENAVFEDFRSVWFERGKLHIVEDGMKRADVTRDLLCDIAVAVLEFMYSVTNHSVPARGCDEELNAMAASCLEKLCECRDMDGNITLRDALKKRKRTAGVRATVSKLRDVLSCP